MLDKIDWCHLYEYLFNICRIVNYLDIKNQIFNTRQHFNIEASVHMYSIGRNVRSATCVQTAKNSIAWIGEFGLTVGGECLNNLFLTSILEAFHSE